MKMSVVRKVAHTGQQSREWSLRVFERDREILYLIIMIPFLLRRAGLQFVSGYFDLLPLLF